MRRQPITQRQQIRRRRAERLDQLTHDPIGQQAHARRHAGLVHVQPAAAGDHRFHQTRAPLGCGASVRAGLKEAIGVSWSRTRVKRRKASLGWVSWPLAAMPGSCRSRGRIGDAIAAKSQRLTLRICRGPARWPVCGSTGRTPATHADAQAPITVVFRSDGAALTAPSCLAER